ncbi:hypothetical protein FSP39_006991 [Pinctada imbricata]|uniref:Uncharacterized protein n=1 Tax=Pinctada imbricata TaxID=66713 RepID=A0AA88YI41_PINIB|nr:hypothetical protein FSP39_006991 [Pinctada imbricata]
MSKYGQRRHCHVTHKRANMTSAAVQESNRNMPDMVLQSARSFDEIPGPRSYPVIGGLVHIFPGGQFHGMHPNDKQSLCQEMYGNIYKEVLVPGMEFVHIFDPVDIEKVFRGDQEFPVRQAFFTLDFYNRKYNKQQGLLTSQGENWHRIRKNVQQKMLRPKAVTAYLPEQTIVADELLEHVRKLKDDNSEVADLRPEFDKYAAECVGVVCFNKRLQAFDDDPDSEAANFIKAVDTIMYILSTKYTALHLEEMEKADDEADGEHGDLIPYLLSKTSLSQEDVLTVISEFIFAGVDTTSHHLSFMMYLLGKNPEVQEKLSEEIQANIPNKQQITSSILSKMSYLRAVTKETHRLLPVAPGNVRTSSQDLVLSGYHVPAGKNIVMHHTWIMLQDEHFKDALAFKPERWIRNNESHHNAHPFAMLPFGHGVRSCIGRRLAEQEAQIAIIKILQNFKVEYTGEPLQTVHSITVTPISKMRFRLTERYL